jgi:hypothetical protein
MDKDFPFKNYILRHLTSYSPLQVNRYFEGTSRVRLPALLTTCFHAGFLSRLFFDQKVGGDMFSVAPTDFQRTARHYTPQDRTFQDYRCENLK